MTGKIFISYRRSDSKAITDRIYASLVERFGRDAVFYDIDTIGPGVDWRAHIREEVGKARVVLAIISRSWLAEMQARVADPQDVLRFELETALARGISVVPVLIERTEMPRAGELPASLGRLPDLNAAMVHEARYFFTDMDALAERLAAGWGFERRVAAPGVVGKPRPATADLVVASPYAGPAVPPPKAQERWETVELPAKLQKLWSRGPTEWGAGERGASWGFTRAAWNDDAGRPLLGFSNRGKVGFLQFPGADFKSRFLFLHDPGDFFGKEFWQFPICFDWAHLGGEAFVFGASCGIGEANPGFSSRWHDRDGKRIFDEPIFGGDQKSKRVFGINRQLLFIDGNKASLCSGGYWNLRRIDFEIPYPVDADSELCVSASSKLAILSTSEHPIALHFPDDIWYRYDRLTSVGIEIRDALKIFDGGALAGRRLAFSLHAEIGVLAVVSYTFDEKRVHTWRIWLMDANGNLIAPAAALDHKANVEGLDWSSTGRFIAVASVDHSVSLWDLATGDVRRIFGHSGPVRRVQFSPDGQRLASLGDKEAIIWHPETGDRVASWPASGPLEGTLRGTFWAPDARMIATTSSHGLEIRRLAI